MWQPNRKGENGAESVFVFTSRRMRKLLLRRHSNHTARRLAPMGFHGEAGVQTIFAVFRRRVRDTGDFFAKTWRSESILLLDEYFFQRRVYSFARLSGFADKGRLSLPPRGRKVKAAQHGKR